MGQYCCKSKKGGTTEKKEEKKKPEAKVVEVPDYIFDCKWNNGFKQYMEANFELNNLEKYLIVETGAIFTFDLITKVFMASFVWKNIIHDHMTKPLMQERIKKLREGDEDGYKKIIINMEELEDKVFQSCFLRVKNEL